MSGQTLRMNLLPPGPVTDRVEVEVRLAIRGGDRTRRGCITVGMEGRPAAYRQDISVAAGAVAGAATRLPTSGLAGTQSIRAVVEWDDGARDESARSIEILPSEVRSTRRISGAWVSLLHWSDAEGQCWNNELRGFDASDWRGLVRDMHDVGMDLLIIQETWRNPAWYGEHYHTMTLDNFRESYAGKAFYPSRLWPGRMDIGCEDSIGVILSEADRLGMHVMLGVGLYAWFDYTPGSLAWHKLVASELWERYGHHDSLYGWYISEEMSGRLKPHEIRYWDRTDQFRDEALTFFREMTAHMATFAPHMPIMLAPDCFFMEEALEAWEATARHCSILCVQGARHRRVDGAPVHVGEKQIADIQAIVDEAGSHLWLDLEAFRSNSFEEPDAVLGNAADDLRHGLKPERMDVLANELHRLHQFEFVCAYQYPGIFNSPTTRKPLGGPAATCLYEDYQRHLDTPARARTRDGAGRRTPSISTSRTPSEPERTS